MRKFYDQIRQRFEPADERTLALRTLQLREDASSNDITLSYRRLASRYHPDRGGDTESFIQLRQAYELLRRAH